jgi:hypothetical protein
MGAEKQIDTGEEDYSILNFSPQTQHQRLSTLLDPQNLTNKKYGYLNQSVSKFRSNARDPIWDIEKQKNLNEKSPPTTLQPSVIH